VIDTPSVIDTCPLIDTPPVIDTLAVPADDRDFQCKSGTERHKRTGNRDRRWRRSTTRR
jgi:hypothetical protein